MQSTLYAQVEQILDVLPELTGSFELIIIDDGSTDATIEVADELARRYPQVLVVRHGVPRGSAAALQSGLRQSSGEVICVRDEHGGLPLDQVPKTWWAMHRAAAQDTAGRPLGGRVLARRHPALVGGFQMIQRKAIGSAGEIAATIGEGQPSATVCPGRPTRPNFLRPSRVS
jgi:glycosyltransferase involved in cell wall biosynthesis